MLKNEPPSLRLELLQEKPETVTIDLSNAFLCGNDHITSSAMQCDCGSRALLSLSAVLNRVSADPVVLLAEEWREFLGNNEVLSRIGKEN
jgi:hypothetical protein